MFSSLSPVNKVLLMARGPRLEVYEISRHSVCAKIWFRCWLSSVRFSDLVMHSGFQFFTASRSILLTVCGHVKTLVKDWLVLGNSAYSTI